MGKLDTWRHEKNELLAKLLYFTNIYKSLTVV